jgi:polyisoprenoid-binding protein YceI
LTRALNVSIMGTMQRPHFGSNMHTATIDRGSPRPARTTRLALTGALLAVLGLAAAPPHAAAREYAVDADASQVRLRVLRAGPFAALAHDHILIAKGLAGRISFNPAALSSATGQLSVPVAFLEVDDPKERAQEGFAGELSESNRASIRENMLAADQLDVAEFPRITLAVERVEGGLPSPRLYVRVKIRDREQTLNVPATISADSGTLVVSGETELLQSAFGIAPYSSLFGAIAVQDAVRIMFQIVARAE